MASLSELRAAGDVRLLQKKKEEMKLQIKKINTEQKSAAVQKPKLTAKKPAKASPSAARTKNLKPKSKRS